MAAVAVKDLLKIDQEFVARLKARYTCMWVESTEETRVESNLIRAAGLAKYETFFWDCKAGITDMNGKPIAKEMADPNGALDWIRDKGKRGVYVLRDVDNFFDPYVRRNIKNLAHSFQGAKPEDAKTLVILSAGGEIPKDLTGEVTVITYPRPDREEIGKILDDTIEANNQPLLVNGERDGAIDAAIGLSHSEAANCFAKSLVIAKKIVPSLILAEKKSVIARGKILTWYEPDPRGLDGIGGLEFLKDWLVRRKAAFSARARAFGLPSPKGVMLAGVPGCGKSLTAKCVASAWGIPLLRLDFGALRDKYVGESERKIRDAFNLAEVVAPCALWCDEIEKALGGATGPQGDGGVASDALGTFLSWMQEHTAPVFVIATANDVSNLPPELLRKGRFDELFFVDLPTAGERQAILKATLKQFNREVSGIERLTRVTDGFTGSEIAALVPDALFAAFADNERAITIDDLEEAAVAVSPLSKTASVKIESLREWAKTRTRPASRAAETETSGTRGRAVEVD